MSSGNTIRPNSMLEQEIQEQCLAECQGFVRTDAKHTWADYEKCKALCRDGGVNSDYRRQMTDQSRDRNPFAQEYMGKGDTDYLQYMEIKGILSHSKLFSINHLLGLGYTQARTPNQVGPGTYRFFEDKDVVATFTNIQNGLLYVLFNGTIPVDDGNQNNVYIPMFRKIRVVLVSPNGVGYVQYTDGDLVPIQSENQGSHFQFTVEQADVYVDGVFKVSNAYIYSFMDSDHSVIKYVHVST